MFQLFKAKSTVDFMAHRKPFVVLSVVITLAAVLILAVRGINWGLDFTGGTLIEVKTEQAADLGELRDTLRGNGFPDAVVQNFGASDQVLIRLMPREDSGEKLGDEVVSLLNQHSSQQVQLRRLEFVGPSVGKELAEEGGLAILAALLVILAYVAMRFEWRFAVGAVLALAHDVLATLGLFSLLQVEFDLSIIAALLTVVGYSLNDTIVVSDRIRENFRKLHNLTPVEVVNESLTQTFSRTIITSLTTVMVLLALFFLGGELIHGFAIALLFGVIVGTHSSIYVASTLSLALGIKREDFIPKEVEKEGADLDPIP